MRGLEKKVISRRKFLASFGRGLLGITGVSVAGCSGEIDSFGILKPKGRFGDIPIPMPGIVDFLNPKNLGIHNFSEKAGLVYACKAGHIDLPHLRKAADCTRYFALRFFGHLMRNETEFSFKLKEPSRYYVQLTYPENWENLLEDEKKKIVREISLDLGEYFSYTATTLHEILTWFNPFEFHSSFSWEDNFSNFLGSYLGKKSLENIKDIHDKKMFDKAMTSALDEELEKLDVQSKKVAERVAVELRGKYYTGFFYPLIDVKKRDFDIGLDGSVRAFVFPDVEECENVEPASYPAPNTDVLSKYRISMKFEIEPRGGGKILKIVYSDKNGEKRIEPDKHFAKIMDYIKRDAVKRYGVKVDVP